MVSKPVSENKESKRFTSVTSLAYSSRGRICVKYSSWMRRYATCLDANTIIESICLLHLLLDASVTPKCYL